MNVKLSDAALEDSRQAADWYIEQQAFSAAQDLQRQISRALEVLSRSPGIGTPIGDDLRAWPIHRFPISLVYRVTDEGLLVIAVAGQRRRPGFWAGRD